MGYAIRSSLNKTRRNVARYPFDGSNQASVSLIPAQPPLCGAGRLRLLERSKALTGITAPGAQWVQRDIRLPVPLCFGVRAQLLADESQIVVRIRIVRLKADGLANMLPSGFRTSRFFQHASQVGMGQGVFRIHFESAAEVFGGLFEIAVFVAERSTIDERLGLSGIDTQSAIVGIDRFGPCFSVGFILK